MDIKDIRVLIKMITETDISEFEMEGAEEKIRIKRGNQPEIIQYQIPQQALAIPTAAPAQQVAVPSGMASDAPAAMPEKGKAITSPIVGTFYRSPAPDSPPYVEVGQIVEKGQV